MTEKKYDFAGICFVTGTLLGWASILLFLKHLVPYIDAWTANGWRYGVSALLWLPLLLVGARRGTLPKGIWWRALPATFFNLMGQMLYAKMPYYIGPGLGGFLIRVALVSSMLGAFVLFADERVLLRSKLFWAGMSAIVAGSIGTVFLGHAPIGHMTATGIILGASSGAFFGLYGVCVRYYMRGIPSMTSFSVISLYTATGLVVMMLLFADGRGRQVFDLSAYNWFILILSALIGIAICHVSYYAAIARLGVAISTAIVQLAPFLCAIGAYVWFEEVLSRWQWTSGFVMIAGAMMLLVAEQQRPRPKREEPALDVGELGEAVAGPVGAKA
ncbi:MAG TPA: DMT family transporter [Phycisphaerae bacterium]|nr:DMT family transporter [Phycisphaerae bacterium]